MRKPIPIRVAKAIAEDYGYDQVLIFAANRTDAMNHVTTYGRTKAYCDEIAHAGRIVGAMFGDQSTEYLKRCRDGLDQEIARRAALVAALGVQTHE